MKKILAATALGGALFVSSLVGCGSAAAKPAADPAVCYKIAAALKHGAMNVDEAYFGVVEEYERAGMHSPDTYDLLDASIAKFCPRFSER